MQLQGLKAMNAAKFSTTELAFEQRGTGLPVLLIHGFPLDHTMWDAQIKALSPFCRVIAPDLRGFGQSSLGQYDQSNGVSMERYAEDLIELLDKLKINESVVVVGFSMGGYVAWQLVRRHPARIRALVPCDTRASSDNEEGRAARIKMAENVATWGSGRVAEMMGPKLFAPLTCVEKPGVVTAVRRVVERTAPAAIAAAQRGMAARPDVTSWLPTIKAPALVIVGEHDAVSPPDEMKSIAEAIAGAQFVKVADAGHMTTMENPDDFNDALVGFLEAISS
jgi:pimeloyl-ACP methyl ester carboxylesterase